ncbi:AbrB/MazE/SpoVT family DNA-binding domain-containing protein [Dethiobacter alkaliphilus]|uniref:AbrB/MazE/SpoVT family DNA-binding domain-containing protein n=1 Tax=Dethiobacter alkaliphilus TaxID=427926 RepID=UPI00222767A4|nr:AbrB/MazE/SpoVT family DNA-binding domain-containing protein [Dethiobacter alkaliphilus]MCW3491147.1 AbrB/MazE/SpoVT family DNA-binding domain-containing protein [Dethiobacter alkaliphilus]
MPTVKLSSRRRLTIPASICEKLAIKEGDDLIMSVDDSRIILFKAPESFTDYFSGIAKGLYGKTADEIDEYVNTERP